MAARVPRFSAFVRRGRRAVGRWRLSKAGVSTGDGSAAAAALGGPSACPRAPPPANSSWLSQGFWFWSKPAVSGRAAQAESGMRPQGSGPLRPKALPLAVVGCARAQRGQAGGGEEPLVRVEGGPGAREVARVLEEAAQGCLTVGCGL